MNNKEILKNAPDGATHTIRKGVYYKFNELTPYGLMFYRVRGEAWIGTDIDCLLTRSLADIREIEQLKAELATAKAELDDAHNDACFYKSCALSGEVPAEGCQPSVAREAKEQGE